MDVDLEKEEKHNLFFYYFANILDFYFLYCKIFKLLLLIFFKKLLKL